LLRRAIQLSHDLEICNSINPMEPGFRAIVPNLIQGRGQGKSESKSKSNLGMEVVPALHFASCLRYHFRSSIVRRTCHFKLTSHHRSCGPCSSDEDACDDLTSMTRASRGCHSHRYPWSPSNVEACGILRSPHQASTYAQLDLILLSTPSCCHILAHDCPGRAECSTHISNS
jgi:hypothetical protein